MFARKSRFSSAGRSMTFATIAALALTSVEPSIAFAAPAPAKKVTSFAAHDGLTEVAAKRKTARSRRGNNAGAAAAAAAFAGIVGTGIAIAASRSNRDYYDDGYYGWPGYYGGAPYYYGGYGGYRGGGPYYRGYPAVGW